jgi:type I restriction-modification system DNA methylase subunit
MVRLYDYSKYTEAKGAFAVLFPEELRRPWTAEMLERIAVDPSLKYVVTAIFQDFRPSQRFVGNLSEIADWISSQVLRPLAVEADTGFAIKVLTEAVDALTACVRGLKSKELEDIFGGKTVFENILEYEEGQYPIEEMRQAATYLLVNQIIFYHVLSCVDSNFKRIEEEKIDKPTDLLEYFEAVLRKDYSSVFGFDVASRLPESATQIIRKIIMTVKALAPEKIGHDILGKVFHELIPFNIRKAVAAFYTNNEAAEILAQLSIDKPDAKVMDLACGSGTLLVASYRRKKELLQKLKGSFSKEDHRRFLEEDLTGIDIMPFAAHLAVMHLSIQALTHETEKVRIGVWDSTELKPKMNIPAIYSELRAAYKRPTLDMFKEKFEIPKEAYIKKGAITLEGVGGEKIPLEKADLVIMNPPFTRTERLPESYRKKLRKHFRDYDNLIWGRVGIHLFFVFLADKFVEKNGRIALVLPATVLRIKSMKGARELWTKNYHIEYIITTLEKAAFSEASQFREILLIAKKIRHHSEKESPPNNLKCGIVYLKKLPQNIEEAKNIVNSILLQREIAKPEKIYEDNFLSLRFVTQKELREKIENLFVLISMSDVKLNNLWQQVVERAGKRFAKYEEYIKKGVDISVTPANSTYNFRTTFFFISRESRAIKKHDTWVVESTDDNYVYARHRFLNEKVAIPKKALSLGFRRPSGTGTIDISASLDYMVKGSFPELNKLVEQERKATKLVRNVKSWERLVNKANLLLSRRFDLSAVGTKHLAFFSSIPTFGIDMWDISGFDEEDSKIMTIWLNSSLNILQMLLHRTETRGAWMKLHQYQIRNSFTLNIKMLNSEDRKILLVLFDKLKNLEFPSILEQIKGKYPLRVEIDRAILRVLGFSDEEASFMLNYLYPALANEIEKLKTLMEG